MSAGGARPIPASASAQNVCHYCGLPLPRSLRRHRRASPHDSEPRYCCFGCSLAAEITRQSGRHGAAQWTLVRLGLGIFFTMNVMVFTVVLWSQDVYDVQNQAGFSSVLIELFRYLALLFSIPVLLLLGLPVLDDAWRKLKQGIWSTELLIVFGVSASFAYSVMSVFSGEGHVYFEIGCMVLVALTLGRWLEATGRLHASDTLDSLQRLLPETVQVIRNGRQQQVALNEVVPGDEIRVLPGQRIPADGQVLSRQACVDEQVITGESLPCTKTTGDTVYGGTLNLDSVLALRVAVPSEAGAMARLIRAVRQARQQSGRYEKLADRVTAWFVPGISVVAVGAFAWHAHTGGFQAGVQTSLAVLLIACPCALALATPLAVWAAVGRAAGLGIVFRDSRSLERLAEVRAVRFDKTGTLTDGAPVVCRLVLAPGTSNDEVLRRAVLLAQASQHPVAQAILSFAQRSGIEQSPLAVAHVETRTGHGLLLKSTDRDKATCLGSPRFVSDQGLQIPPVLEAAIEQAMRDGTPLCCIGWGTTMRGVFFLSESLRAEAASVLTTLQEQGFDVAVLTGDHPARGAAISRRLGVRVVAELLPDDKVDELRRAQRQLGAAMMVGDGMNDAPALAASDVGIAMGCGADITRDSADVCLLGNNLASIPLVIGLARQTVRTIRQNLFWAFAYNSVGILLAVSGRLNPILAAIAMSLSSFFVVSNSLRLRGFGPSRSPAAPAHSPREATATPSSGVPGPIEAPLDFSRSATAAARHANAASQETANLG